MLRRHLCDQVVVVGFLNRRRHFLLLDGLTGGTLLLVDYAVVRDVVLEAVLLVDDFTDITTLQSYYVLRIRLVSTLTIVGIASRKEHNLSSSLSDRSWNQLSMGIPLSS